MLRFVGTTARTMSAQACCLVLPLVLLHGQPCMGNDKELVFGMSTALSGPTAVLGVNMHDGVMAAFGEANQSGIIAGRKLRLVALDDGYEPARTTPNIHQLIDQERVLAIIGNVGTPTAIAAIPIANAKKTPFIGAFTGAGVLRKSPPDRYVINYRASYAEETAAMVTMLIQEQGLGVDEIGFFTQRDAYGDAGFVGGVAALRRYGLPGQNAVTHGRYERNTIAVENGLADLMEADPPVRAVIMVGTYEPCAEFIKLARKFGLDAVFLNVSFVGAAQLVKTLGEDGQGVFATQVVPPLEAELPIVRDYQNALQQHVPNTEASFGSLEGYIVGRMVIQAIARIDGPPTRETLVDAMEELGPFDIGLGVPLRLGSGHHQACHQVWWTVLQDGKVVPFAPSQEKLTTARK
jgi:ABC-type branched-subunit amino acid transport system substrate-binding protein